jgi:hypothetical protein
VKEIQEDYLTEEFPDELFSEEDLLWLETLSND